MSRCKCEFVHRNTRKLRQESSAGDNQEQHRAGRVLSGYAGVTRQYRVVRHASRRGSDEAQLAPQVRRPP